MNRKQPYYTPPFEEYAELINELSKLQLYFLWNWLKTHPEEKFEDALYNRIDLCRKTDPHPKHYDVADMDDITRPEWIRIKHELKSIYEETVNDDNAASFEHKGFDIVKKTVATFADASYGKHGKFDDYQCGSLKFNPLKDNAKTVYFHIGNAVAPKSIFTDSNYLAQCLLELMDKAESEYEANTIYTSTWLNSLPKWLKYFPTEWIANLGPENKDVGWHFGFWGQFISAKETFNYKYAKILRETGKMPFAPRTSHCSFTELKNHLVNF